MANLFNFRNHPLFSIRNNIRSFSKNTTAYFMLLELAARH